MTIRLQRVKDICGSQFPICKRIRNVSSINHVLPPVKCTLGYPVLTPLMTQWKAYQKNIINSNYVTKQRRTEKHRFNLNIRSDNPPK